MPENREGKSLGEIEFSSLCAHYKDTHELHQASIKQRDIQFYALLVITGLISLQLAGSDDVDVAVSGYISRQYGVAIGAASSLICSMLWLLLFGISTKYYQSVIHIERQYQYIHHLEELLNARYAGTWVFTREGKAYLDQYPLFSSWIGLLYTVAFPMMILFATTFRIYSEWISHPISAGPIIDLVCYITVFISTILYLIKMHTSSVTRSSRNANHRQE